MGAAEVDTNELCVTTLQWQLSSTLGDGGGTVLFFGLNVTLLPKRVTAAAVVSFQIVLRKDFQAVCVWGGGEEFSLLPLYFQSSQFS